MIKRIVVGTDGSAIALRALEVALDLAGELKVMPEIHVVSAVDYIELGGGLSRAPRDAPNLLADDADVALEVAAELASERGFQIQTHRIDGHAASVLLELAREISADLIVVGTHGRRGAALTMLGSVCERLLHESKVPVLTVHQ